jgi:predicted transcriptional regulator
MAMRCPTSFTLKAEVREALARIAASESRSKSQVVELAVLRYAAARDEQPVRAEEAAQ